MTVVREATREDERAIRRVHDAAIRTLASDAYDERQVEAWTSGEGDGESTADEDSALPDPSQHLVVAEQEDDVVGFGHLDVPETTVQAVYVHPDEARSGVGARILTTLEETARERGLDAVTLHASLNAVAFYERQGYERLGETTHELSATVDLSCVEMRKRL